MKRTLNIKLNGKNANERIKAALAEVQSGCKARLVNENAVFYAVNQIESRLGIPKKYLDGVCVLVDTWAQKFPGAYNGIPESTHFEIENRKGEWYLVCVWRARVEYPTNRYILLLPPTAQTAIVNRFLHFGE